ncbi:hypothetical protein LCGC14_3055780, partial [marine sediment metagenome]
LGSGTRVLTADLRWVPIEDIQVGDQLVAVDEKPPGGAGPARKMRSATVLARQEMYAEAYRVTFDTGESIIGTGEHPFLCKKRSTHDYQWRTILDIQVGDEIRCVTKPWGDTTVEDSWFGGFLDGEGSLRARQSGGADVCVSQVAGAVLEHAASYLKSGNYNFHTEVDNRVPEHSSKFGKRPVYKLVVQRMDDMFQLLGRTQPIRFGGNKWWEGKELPNGKLCAKVVSIKPLLVLKVHNLQTTTGTFIAEGLVSHNTAICRSLSAHRLTTVPGVRVLAGSVDEDKVMELYTRDKTILDNLPWWLKPEIKYDEKGAHIHFGKLSSKVLYQVGSQKSGVGQGRQFDVIHLTECASWP